LDDTAIRAIRNVLDQVPDTSNAVEIDTTDAASKLASSISDVKAILDALVSLYVLKSGSESVTLEQFVDDICEAMGLLDSEARVTEAQRPTFRERILTLLSADRFWLVSKAYDLQTDDERTFCDARILTDLRPIFDTPVTAGSKGAVIVHLLKLGYHESNKRHQKFYVSLDSKDLKELRKVIDRAEEKAATLKSQFKDTRFLGLS
jgi:hypothetical protein